MVDFPDRNYGVSSSTQTAEAPSTQKQAMNINLSSSDASFLKRDKHQRLGTEVAYREQVRGSWVNIKLLKDDRLSSDSNSTNDNCWRGEGDVAKNQNKMESLGGSLDRVSTDGVWGH